MVRKGTSRAEALVNRAQPTSKTPTSGHSTKLERMNKRFGRREELLCSALSMINPQPTKDGKYPQVYIINPRKNRIKTIDLTCLSIKVSWFQINSQVCVCVCVCASLRSVQPCPALLKLLLLSCSPLLGIPLSPNRKACRCVQLTGNGHISGFPTHR